MTSSTQQFDLKFDAFSFENSLVTFCADFFTNFLLLWLICISFLQIKRCHLEKHEHDFNTTHTKLLFKELVDTKKQLLTTTKLAQKTQTELQDTKSKLETTTKIAQKTQTELQDTKLKLESTTKIAQKTQTELQDTKLKLETTTKIAQKTQTELQDTKLKLETTTKITKETQRELKDTKEELNRVKEQMKTKKEKIEEKCVVKPNPATAPKVPWLKAEVKIVDVARLMGELVQPNPPQTTQQTQQTQQTYAEKIHLVFNEINEGQLFHINDNECFFKLRIRRIGDTFKLLDHRSVLHLSCWWRHTLSIRKHEVHKWCRCIEGLFVVVCSSCCDRKIR